MSSSPVTTKLEVSPQQPIPLEHRQKRVKLSIEVHQNTKNVFNAYLKGVNSTLPPEAPPLSGRSTEILKDPEAAKLKIDELRAAVNCLEEQLAYQKQAREEDRKEFSKLKEDFAELNKKNENLSLLLSVESSLAARHNRSLEQSKAEFTKILQSREDEVRRAQTALASEKKYQEADRANYRDRLHQWSEQVKAQKTTIASLSEELNESKIKIDRLESIQEQIISTIKKTTN